jgi:hypothetical protein
MKTSGSTCFLSFTLHSIEDLWQSSCQGWCGCWCKLLLKSLPHSCSISIWILTIGLAVFYNLEYHGSNTHTCLNWQHNIAAGQFVGPPDSNLVIVSQNQLHLPSTELGLSLGSSLVLRESIWFPCAWPLQDTCSLPKTTIFHWKGNHLDQGVPVFLWLSRYFVSLYLPVV